MTSSVVPYLKKILHATEVQSLHVVFFKVLFFKILLGFERQQYRNSCSLHLSHKVEGLSLKLLLHTHTHTHHRADAEDLFYCLWGSEHKQGH